MQIQRSLASLTAIFVPAIASLLLFASCVASAANPGPHAQQDDPNATPTSSVEPRFVDFASKAEPVLARESVASKGDCAPRYHKAGATGTQLTRSVECQITRPG